ncbi:3-phosphoshikimate 1-carboxyvinyltransferase [Hufsiella ginkgonis]|uniref:3-phosphoshikimate 1-carboxyvinyltransferase n=1 Tax=Hufsiella ginkgonis TaxID=2695274 RepID=A0A7K1Y4X1_9SPHI|nr:3-phosphoshikimate 1-carboxyvinyltransferase [Hufsiella ginkgonis]MXV17766.1 3-phosphoshikimate 1-carboxyvinyltransferase [Hufsiella ginkgonis]
MSGGNLVLSAGKRDIHAEIRLTGSKSESNRALVLEALSDGGVKVENLSEAADTVTLNKILRSLVAETPITIVDVGPAGTAMRFLTAFAAVKGIEAIITGTARMKQRPIGLLVDALRTLGASITYAEADGFPPVNTHPGFRQQTRVVSIKGDISSQYITALLLVAPVLPQGLELEIEGELTSRPYVEMTLSMLSQVGISHEWNGDRIVIPRQPFIITTLTVEPDWSAASYWYAMAALAETSAISLPNLRKYSLQGDSRIAEIMANFGVTSTFVGNGLEIKKEPKTFVPKLFDLKDCPDLAQTVIVCCAALGHNASFTGLETLKIKETDRIQALQNELAKFGVKFTADGTTYHLDSSERFFPEKIRISTYEDHRMAMAFAPLALVIKEVEIEDYLVVEKSYPDFWTHLAQIGIISTEQA